jgi:hypothetical protein
MRPSPKNPTVTLSTSGQFGLNAAVVRNLIGESRYALLLFDQEKSLVGIKFLKTNEPDAYPIKISPNKGHGSVTGMAFMKSYNIMPAQTKAYPASYDDKTKILSVDLAGAGGTIKKK